jgi:hypothetical protein
VIDPSAATRYIAVAAPSDVTNAELKSKDPARPLLLPVYHDYALMKVLHNLRKGNGAFGIHVNTIQHTVPVSPLDFSGLRDSDIIFIAGHGNAHGLHVLGPDPVKGMDRLIDILTADGNLQRHRQGKKITILLLSCRAGLGFHKALAFTLSERLSIPVTVGGAVGFTFGSIKTSKTARNEVLIRGIPWHIEYRGSLTPREAEEATSAREGRTITIASKQADIDRFFAAKTVLEEDMADIVIRIDSTEINEALIELDLRFGQRGWERLLRRQFEFYRHAREQDRSNLEFDMWFPNVVEGYVWTDGRNTTAAEVNAILTGDLVPVGTGYTSTR